MLKINKNYFNEIIQTNKLIQIESFIFSCEQNGLMTNATIALDAEITDDVTRRCIPIKQIDVNKNGERVLTPMENASRADNISSIILKEDKDRCEVLLDDDSTGQYGIQKLKWWDNEIEYQIFGKSDDLIEIRGYESKEFYYSSGGSIIEIGDCTIKIEFDDNGNWRFEVRQEGTAHIENYSLDSETSNMFCEYSELLTVSFSQLVDDIEQVV